MTVPRHVLALLLSLLIALMLSLHAEKARAGLGSQPSIFGSQETARSDLRLFPQWLGTLSRYADQIAAPRNCGGGNFAGCNLDEWQDFLNGIKHSDALAQIEAVNAEMNRRRYIVDPRNWGVPDYWATPFQFFAKDGDCEDYAIAKFISLRTLGFANEDLRIVVLRDTNLDALHAVLVAYVEGQPYVLDNQIRSVVRAQSIRHYRPIYSLNETTWWRHTN